MRDSRGGSGDELSERTVLELQEVTDWLLANDFAPARQSEQRETHLPMNQWSRPDGYLVVFGPRLSNDGVSGWIEDPARRAVLVTSNLEVQTLDETFDRMPPR